MKHDLTNQRFGRLTAKEVVRKIPGKGDIWRCECDCGGERKSRPPIFGTGIHEAADAYIRKPEQVPFDTARISLKVHHSVPSWYPKGCVPTILPVILA